MSLYGPSLKLDAMPEQAQEWTVLMFNGFDVSIKFRNSVLTWPEKHSHPEQCPLEH